MVTILLVFILSRLSFHFVRELYLEQLSSQVTRISSIAARQIDPVYLELLNIGSPSGTLREYFDMLFRRIEPDPASQEMFIFDRNFTVAVHSGRIKEGMTESRLLINRKEIMELAAGKTSSSLPFKGDDGRWYLWGFCRLNDNYWLAVRESAARLEKVDTFSAIFWGVGFLGTIITVILAWVAAVSVTKPLDRLVYFSGEIGKGNFKSEIPAGLRGEIAELASAMEKMKLGLANTQKEKENILAQIAHEIRNPLGGIELLGNLVKEDLEKDGRDTDYISRMLDEVNKLKALITAYLNYSRPLAVNPQLISVSELSHEIEQIFHERLCSKNASLSFAENDLRFYFDPVHLRNILVNLISNSIEMIPQSGTVKVISGQQNSSVFISVEDNGTGIKPEDLNRIFEPFYTTRKDGTGLGLAICRKLCEENNSELIVESSIPGKTVFTILKEMPNEAR